MNRRLISATTVPQTGVANPSLAISRPANTPPAVVLPRMASTPPPVYRPQASGTALPGHLPGGAPSAYRPAVPTAILPRMSSAPPPVYRPQASGGVVPAHSPLGAPAVVLPRMVLAPPPVYRPQPIPIAVPPRVPASASMPPAVQLSRRHLNPKQEAQRQRIFDRRVRRSRLAAAERQFQEVVSQNTHPVSFQPHHAFPFDFDQQPRTGRAPSEQPVAEFIERLPSELRGPKFRGIASIGDLAHGVGGTRVNINRTGMLESLTAWQFARERGIDPSTIKAHSDTIDFKATDREENQVLFDPLIPPSLGPGSSQMTRQW